MMRRTTITADAESLATLEREARRRGVSLSSLIAEAVDEKAAQTRARHRPRLGIGRSTDGKRASELASEPIARPPR